jgi:putative PIN family toxin of toxin-antitoxin system
VNDQPLLVVCDTNALIPLAVSQTERAKTLRRAWVERCFALFATPPILAEFERVLRYPRVRRNHGLTEAVIQRIVTLVRDRVYILSGDYDVSHVGADPTDNIFLACVLEAGADYLVSEDDHLRQLKYYHGTQIISLTQFVQVLSLPTPTP